MPIIKVIITGEANYFFVAAGVYDEIKLLLAKECSLTNLTNLINKKQIQAIEHMVRKDAVFAMKESISIKI